jgi:hypothetical protein
MFTQKFIIEIYAIIQRVSERCPDIGFPRKSGGKSFE